MITPLRLPRRAGVSQIFLYHVLAVKAARPIGEALGPAGGHMWSYNWAPGIVAHPLGIRVPLPSSDDKPRSCRVHSEVEATVTSIPEQARPAGTSAASTRNDWKNTVLAGLANYIDAGSIVAGSVRRGRRTRRGQEKPTGQENPTGAGEPDGSRGRRNGQTRPRRAAHTIA